MRTAVLLAATLAVGSASRADHPQPRDILQTAAANGFKTLLAAVVAADLYDDLKAAENVTVLAPTDAAFDKLGHDAVATLLKPENKAALRAVLAYHVIPNKNGFAFGNVSHPGTFEYPTLAGPKVTLATDGRAYTVNGSVKLITKNVRCKNGTVVVIDGVLTPPDAKPTAGKNTIPAVAAKAGTFATLLAAVTAADLADTLAGPGPFTVFAPTDAAFRKLPEGAVARLLKPENKADLVALLKYHVVAGKVSARMAVATGDATTLQGGRVTARIADGKLVINDSTVVKSDVPAANGVIHAIDTVLMPPGR